MARLRHKTTAHEITVPDGYDPKAYPNYEPADTKRRTARKSAPRKRTAKKTAPPATPTE